MGESCIICWLRPILTILAIVVITFFIAFVAWLLQRYEKGVNKSLERYENGNTKQKI